MAYSYRGKRTAYDNIAAGSVAGVERTLPQSTSDHTRYDGTSVTDPSLYSPVAVSPYGAILETGGFSNIANAELPGVEDTDNATADKITSAGEDVAN